MSDSSDLLERDPSPHHVSGWTNAFCTVQARSISRVRSVAISHSMPASN